jgi:hypothetical protein
MTVFSFQCYERGRGERTREIESDKEGGREREIKK